MTIEIGKPMPYFCPACQAIPTAGYCKLAGCPTAPDPDQNQPSEVKEGGAQMASALQWIEACASVLASSPRLTNGARDTISDIAAKAREALAARPPSMERGEAVVLQADHWRNRFPYSRGHPDFVADTAGLDHWRADALIGGGHDMTTVNKNTLFRFVETIDKLIALLDAAPSPAPSAVEMAGVDREAIARIVYEANPCGDQPTDLDGRPTGPGGPIAWADMPEYDAGLYESVLETADAILALATASRGKGAGGVHMAHCNRGEYLGSCKYGEADCPATTSPASMPQTGGEA